jgi:hypothetical protein
MLVRGVDVVVVTSGSFSRAARPDRSLGAGRLPGIDVHQRVPRARGVARTPTARAGAPLAAPFLRTRLTRFS